MNKELATILKGKLTGLPFVDLLCGMVQTLTYTDAGPDDTTVTKKKPVTYDHNDSLCMGQEIEAIPNSAKKSIIYFEDFGISVVGKKHGLTEYNSSIRLVLWADRSKLVGSHYTEVSARMMSAIIGTLANHNPQNVNNFTTLRTEVARIQPQDAAIFGRYTYNETDRQYLRPPFEFFAIDFTCKFFMSYKCFTAISWNQTTCS